MASLLHEGVNAIRGLGLFKIVTWNVNGIQARQNGVRRFLETESPDILLLQETKCGIICENKLDFPGYVLKLNPCISIPSHHHGTGVIYRAHNDFISVEDIILPGHPNEGRIQLITIADAKLSIVNVYVPNSGCNWKNPLARLKYRCESWDIDFFTWLRTLPQETMVCGDLNVAIRDYDVYNPKHLAGAAGFTAIERRGFQYGLLSDFEDVWDNMHLHVRGKDRYTYSAPSQRSAGRGWRLDYFLKRKNSLMEFKTCEVMHSVLNSSDHVPVCAEIRLVNCRDQAKSMTKLYETPDVT